MNDDFGDDLSDKDIQYRYDTIVGDCVDYVTKPKEDTGWMYPAKSYVVALCYAQWISEDFDEDFNELLYQDTYKPLKRSQYRSMNHHRTRFFIVLVGVFKQKAFRQIKIHLYRSALPLSL
jgi:hypothetical protein